MFSVFQTESVPIVPTTSNVLIINHTFIAIRMYKVVLNEDNDLKGDIALVITTLSRGKIHDITQLLKKMAL